MDFIYTADNVLLYTESMLFIFFNNSVKYRCLPLKLISNKFFSLVKLYFIISILFLFQGTGETLQVKGQEIGVTTKRKRRCGWLDVVLLKYTQMINGFTGYILPSFFIMKLLGFQHSIKC